MISSECRFSFDGNSTYVFDYPCEGNSTSCHSCATVLSPGVYKLQLWGASGGDGEVGIGGYGGFSQGYYETKTKQLVYLYIGGKGESSTDRIVHGGFNAIMQ